MKNLAYKFDEDIGNSKDSVMNNILINMKAYLDNTYTLANETVAKLCDRVTAFDNPVVPDEHRITAV